jgi:transcriptional regulator with XRE-family HTH domain
VEAEDRGRERPAFGVLVREYRIAAGLTQEALAERARMSTNGIGSLERGDRRAPQRDTVALLADALKLTPPQRAAFEAAAGRPGRPPSRHQAASAGQGRALHNLPSSLAQFIGRDTEVVEIEALMREHRLVTLTGAGGLGKTRVALEVGIALSEDSPEGVWLVELAALRDPSLVPATIARTLDAHEVPHQTLLETLVAFLRNKSLVLILDNCEHVIEEARATATAITRTCPGVRILATSREALRVGGEQVYHLQSLAVPDAMALFADRAVAVDARFILSDQNEPIVEEICRRHPARDRTRCGARQGARAAPARREARRALSHPHRRRSERVAAPADDARVDRLELRPPLPKRAQAAAFALHFRGRVHAREREHRRRRGRPRSAFVARR